VHDDATPTSSEAELLERVRTAWADVLDVDDPAAVPLDTNFLEAGGTSLLLIMLWEELHELTDRDLRVSHLFEHATIRAQTALLAGTAETTGTAGTATGTATGTAAGASTGTAAGATLGQGQGLGGADRSRLLGVRSERR
jgi:hypothetical protein